MAGLVVGSHRFGLWRDNLASFFASHQNGFTRVDQHLHGDELDALLHSFDSSAIDEVFDFGTTEPSSVLQQQQQQQQHDTGVNRRAMRVENDDDVTNL
jgi:hypothetical protein